MTSGSSGYLSGYDTSGGAVAIGGGGGGVRSTPAMPLPLRHFGSGAP